MQILTSIFKDSYTFKIVEQTSFQLKSCFIQAQCRDISQIFKDWLVVFVQTLPAGKEDVKGI